PQAILVPPPPPPPPPPHYVADSWNNVGPAPGDYDPFCRWNSPGLFAGVEADLMFPKFTRFSEFPITGLDATVAPVAEIGYRFGWGGAVLFRYRFLASSGSGSFSDPDFGTVGVHSRLEDHTWDIDYQTRICAGANNWGLQWAVGARIAD